MQRIHTLILHSFATTLPLIALSLITASRKIITFIIVSLTTASLLFSPVVATAQNTDPNQSVEIVTFNGRQMAKDMVVIYDFASFDPLDATADPNARRIPSEVPALPASILVESEHCRKKEGESKACDPLYTLTRVEESENTGQVSAGLYQIDIMTGTAESRDSIDLAEVISGIEATDSSLCPTPGYMLTSGNHFMSGGNHFMSGGNHFMSGGNHFMSGGNHFMSGGNHFMSGGNHFMGDSDSTEIKNESTLTEDEVALLKFDSGYQSQWAFEMIDRRSSTFTWNETVHVAFVDVFNRSYAEASGLTYVDEARIALPQLSGDTENMELHGNFAYGIFRAIAPQAEGGWAISAFNAEGSALNAGVVDGVTKAVQILEPLLLAENGPTSAIVNMSFGINDADVDACTRKALENVFEYGTQLGIVFVASVGNESSITEYPASSEFVMGVAAVGPNGKLADYSNQGEIRAPGGIRGQELIVRLPVPARYITEDKENGGGQDGGQASEDSGPKPMTYEDPFYEERAIEEIDWEETDREETDREADPQTVAGYGYFHITGTSFAAPIVSGIIANMLSTEVPKEVVSDYLTDISAINCGIVGLSEGTTNACIEEGSGSGPIIQVPAVDVPTVMGAEHHQCQINQPCVFDVAFGPLNGVVTPLSYTMASPIDGLQIDENTGRVSGTPMGGGAHQIAVYASANKIRVATMKFTLNVNRPPIINPLSTQSNLVGDTVGAGFAANDPEHDQMTYAVTNLPPGVWMDYEPNYPAGYIDTDGFFFNTKVGKFRGVPSTAGTYPVTLTVTDVRGGTAEVTFVWTVNDPPTGSNGDNLQGATLGDRSLNFANQRSLFLPLVTR